MARRYQDIYPEPPLLDSAHAAPSRARRLLTLEYFEADPASMPCEVFAQHHVVLNLNPHIHRVENWRGDEHHDYRMQQYDVVVTPAGLRSGWRWYAKSQVIVITLEPEALEAFAEREVGVLLTTQQLHDQPRFNDPDICAAGLMLRDALMSPQMGSDVMFESFARIFLVKLIQQYGQRHLAPDFAAGFTAAHYKRVLDHVREAFGRTITLEELASAAGLSAAHFSRLFKNTIGQTPMQFVTAFRLEQARAMLADRPRPLADIAMACGFADQAHFTRVFKKEQGTTPRAYRQAL